MCSVAVVPSGTVRISPAWHGGFTCSTAILPVLGLIIGAIFVQFASWSWVFWFVALVCAPIALSCIFLIPKQEPRLDEAGRKRHARWKSLDLGGVSILTGESSDLPHRLRFAY